MALQLDEKLDLIVTFACYMMISVSERYTLLLQIGFSEEFVRRLDLNGSPNSCGVRIVTLIENDDMGERLPQILERLQQVKLPKGHPSPFDKK